MKLSWFKNGLRSKRSPLKLFLLHLPNLLNQRRKRLRLKERK
jgi:hypothetical protein